MRRRFFDLLALAGLCLMTYGTAWAAGSVSVWVALSDNGAAYEDAARALRAEIEQTRPETIDWRVAHLSEFDKPEPRPHWVVAVGTKAQRRMQELFADSNSPPPVLAILVPRLAFDRAADQALLRAGLLSAVYLDQPPARQMDLIRLALPTTRRVGVLVGAAWKSHTAGLEAAARDRDMSLVTSMVGVDGLFPALQALFPETDVLLALPDSEVFNSQTAANILTAAYRRHVPLVGFSPAYVKAGALMALYSAPAQVGKRGGELLRQAMTAKSLPSPRWPRDFTVGVNQDVARSLGLALDEKGLHRQLRLKDRP